MSGWARSIDIVNRTVRDTFSADANGPVTIRHTSTATGIVTIMAAVPLDPIRLEESVPGNFTIRWVRAADFGSVVPQRGDTVAVGSTDYLIDQIQEDTGGGLRLILSTK